VSGEGVRECTVRCVAVSDVGRVMDWRALTIEYLHGYCTPHFGSSGIYSISISIAAASPASAQHRQHRQCRGRKGEHWIGQETTGWE
jgi:hypothetical protein